MGSEFSETKNGKETKNGVMVNSSMKVSSQCYAAVKKNQILR